MAVTYIPRSQIVENKTAKIGEWVFQKTGVPFLGKYHLIKGRPYVGATYVPSKKQIPLEKTTTNQLFKILSTSGPNSPAYLMAIGNSAGIGTLVGAAVTAIPIIKGVFTDGDAIPETGFRIFVQKTNEEPKTIKEIKKDSPDYAVAKTNPFFKIVEIDLSKGLDSQLEEAEKVIPGMKIFLGR
jgi:hypothetical protein